MDERAKTVAVAELIAEASRAMGAAIALGLQGWTTREARLQMATASNRIDVAHMYALRAVGMYPAE
jgi:hypothetical protein